MAKLVMLLRKEINSLTRQGMQSLRGLHRKGLAEEKRNKNFLLRRYHQQIMTVKKNMHLILHSSTKALVTVVISAVPD